MLNTLFSIWLNHNEACVTCNSCHIVHDVSKKTATDKYLSKLKLK